MEYVLKKIYGKDGVRVIKKCIEVLQKDYSEKKIKEELFDIVRASIYNYLYKTTEYLAALEAEFNKYNIEASFPRYLHFVTFVPSIEKISFNINDEAHQEYFSRWKTNYGRFIKTFKQAESILKLYENEIKFYTDYLNILWIFEDMYRYYLHQKQISKIDRPTIKEKRVHFAKTIVKNRNSFFRDSLQYYNFDINKNISKEVQNKFFQTVFEISRSFIYQDFEGKTIAFEEKGQIFRIPLLKTYP